MQLQTREAEKQFIANANQMLQNKVLAATEQQVKAEQRAQTLEKELQEWRSKFDTLERSHSALMEKYKAAEKMAGYLEKHLKSASPQAKIDYAYAMTQSHSLGSIELISTIQASLVCPFKLAVN
jgi:hypothetical protein